MQAWGGRTHVEERLCSKHPSSRGKKERNPSNQQKAPPPLHQMTGLTGESLSAQSEDKDCPIALTPSESRSEAQLRPAA